MNHLEKNPVRADFPQLTQRIRGKNLVYLDSAATALKPWPVIEKIGHFYTYGAANIHRGAHFLADQATSEYEATREKVRSLINANSSEEIIFTSGTTESINLIAATWGEKNLNEGDEIIVSELEHHANLVPWQMLAERKKIIIKVAKVSEQGVFDLIGFEKLLTDKTRLVAITHCSNTLGNYLPIAEITRLSHANGTLVAVDGAQAISTIPVDVTKINCDFYSFSAHKLFGPYGVGILYGKKGILESMPPYQGGGSMISQVSFEKTTFNDLPFKFEAGTPNISGVIAFGAAIDYFQKLGFDKIHQIEKDLMNYAMPLLREVSGLKILGDVEEKAPLVSMTFSNLHHSDVAQILDQDSIAVRAGHHCTMPLLEKFKIKGTIRASFSIYNNKSDIDALITGLNKAKEMLS